VYTSLEGMMSACSSHTYTTGRRNSSVWCM